MKNLKHLFTALLLLSATMAFAEEVTINGITYDVITKAKVAKVIAKETGKYSGNIIIPATIEHNGVTYSVTSIENFAFEGCSSLTNVTIPNSVTSIGSYAYSRCYELTSITIPNSVTSIGSSAFSGCSGLTSITIPNSVTSIGDYAFSGCSGLTSITIPNSVTSIGSSAFSGCSGLTSITIPNSVTSIGSSAFSGCDGLTSVTIGNSVTSIGYGAFYNCSGLTSIEIPNSVTSIEHFAFQYCSGLTSIEIPNSVTSIGGGAFYDCSGLTSVTIGNSVTSIGNYAFSGCTSLKDLRIEDGDEILDLGCNYDSYNDIGQGLFYDCPLETLYLGRNLSYNTSYKCGYSPFYNKLELTSITIGNSVTSIEDKAFYKCLGLKEVHITALATWCNIDFENDTSNPLYYARNLYLNKELVINLVIPNNVTEIKNFAFYCCSGFTSITIPNSVTSIGAYAFSDCSGLISVIIGSRVKNIGSKAFAYCDNLTDVYCHATTAPSTNSNTFKESYPEYMTLHVPAEAINDYKTTEHWSSFGTIVALDGNNDTETDVINVPATAVLITSNNGVLYINCALENESVGIYTTNGTLIDETTIENGNATVQSDLSKGSIAIVKIGNKSVKVILN